MEFRYAHFYPHLSWMTPLCAATWQGHKPGGTSPSALLRSRGSSWHATASGWVFKQPLQGCLLTSGVYVVFACTYHLPLLWRWPEACGWRVGWPWTLSGPSGCPEFLSSHRFSKTTTVQGFHNLLSPHVSSPGSEVFWWLFPPPYPQVPIGPHRTSPHRRDIQDASCLNNSRVHIAAQSSKNL